MEERKRGNEGIHSEKEIEKVKMKVEGTEEERIGKERRRKGRNEKRK